MSSTPEVNAWAPIALAVGVVALEFAAAVQSFVVSTLLPVVAADLHARANLGVLVGSPTVGLFIALPLARHVLHAMGPRRLLAFAVVGYLGGVTVSATATTPSQFAAGQLMGGISSGLLAVFGVAAIIEHLDGAVRARVIAASSSMWIVPALVGPATTLLIDHAVGWRFALLLPVPFVLLGRALVRWTSTAREPTDRPVARTLLVPLGAVLLAIAGTSLPLAVGGGLLMLLGVLGLVPGGTLRLARGTPSAVVALGLFAVGYFGADALITVVLTGAYRVSLGRAAIVLSAAPLAWALTSLAMPAIVRRYGTSRPTVVGLLLAAAGTAAVAVGTFGPSYVLALAGWTVGGVGVGIAYPGMYLRASTPDGSIDVATLAAAVITAEAFGNLFGRTLGSVILEGSGCSKLTYAIFAAFLAIAAVAARRAREPI